MITHKTRPYSRKKRKKKKKGLLPVLDPLQTSESHTSVPWKEKDGSFAGLSGRVDVRLGEGGRESRHMGHFLAGTGYESQETVREAPLQPPKVHVTPRMGRGRLVVAGV